MNELNLIEALGVDERMVDTKTLAGRRKLNFETIDDVLSDIDRILAVESAGKLQTIGNWTPGQIMAHVAAWIEYGYDGYPMKPPPFFIRWFLKMKLKQIYARGMESGVRIPGVKDGTFGMDLMSTADAAARLKRAFLRLKNRDPCKYDSPAFGAMSHDQRIKLNLRHAELHLSFIKV